MTMAKPNTLQSSTTTGQAKTTNMGRNPPRETLQTKRGAAVHANNCFEPRHPPRFKPPPENQPSIHRDTPELISSTPSSPQTPSTHVFPLSESINRQFEISSVTIHHKHREEIFARNITIYHWRASIVLHEISSIESSQKPHKQRYKTKP
ncbi:hypothetical protein Bca52824_077199 [Brassica carinata]|uniref:Uncharacterized protein n=1 Tax=Brassica carinata TaxID=52824 RepID=A0A8X7PVF1_BRACI|nr:hypothetical protein Bca52824_077199 [Brassica carinata]